MKTIHNVQGKGNSATAVKVGVILSPTKPANDRSTIKQGKKDREEYKKAHQLK